MNRIKWLLAIFLLISVFSGCGEKKSEVLLEERSKDMNFAESSPKYSSQATIESSLMYSHNPQAKVNPHYPIRPNIRTKHNTNDFKERDENLFKQVNLAPLSTFSADVDTASYALVRKAIESGNLPEKGAVRIEELLNSFTYSYPAPRNGKPIAISAEMSDAIWNEKHKILRIGIKAKAIDWKKRKPFNLVFLIDTSGSMGGENRIELVKKSLKMLVENLNSEDSVGIVTYAGTSHIALQPTNDKNSILQAIDSLMAYGSTHGSEGIKTAYELAQKHFKKGGYNRIIITTDGDFNVGITSHSELLNLIKQKAKSGVYLSVFGYGMGNYKDSMLQQLADSGNGNYGYIDTLLEAKKHLVEQVGATLITVAKDVKIQVEFNPAKIAQYRLIGYEKRLLNDEDFNDDSKDAGEMGSGHTVTALYEIIPVGVKPPNNAQSRLGEGAEDSIDSLKYSKNVANSDFSDEWVSIKLRYKEPKKNNEERSKLIEKSLKSADIGQEGSADMRFAQSVAGFGLILGDSAYRGDINFEKILHILSEPEVSKDAYRKEFLGLVAKASRIKK